MSAALHPSDATTGRSCIAATLPRFASISKPAPRWWWKAQPLQLCTWSHHHACPWACSQHARHWLVLLDDFCARCVCPAVFRRTEHRDDGVSERRWRLRRAAHRNGQWRADACHRSGRRLCYSVLALRIAIATTFAVPAAIAGYHVVFVLSQIGVPSLAWREFFACLGAGCVGVTAWMRLIVSADTRPFEPGRVVQNPS